MRNVAAHQYTDAIAVLPADLNPPETGGYTGTVFDTGDYTDPETLPPAVTGLRGYRGSWWTFVPDTNTATGHPTVVSAYAWNDPVVLDVWRVDAAGWTLHGQAGPSAGGTRQTDPVGGPWIAGQTYYARVAVTADTPQDSVWLVGDGLFVRDPAAADPPGDGTDGTGGGGTGGSPAPVALVLGAARLGVRAPDPSTVSGTITPVSPAGVAVAGTRPAFLAAATTEVPGQWADIQYATTPTFDDPVTVSADVPAGLTDAQVTATAADDLPDGVWWWRARLAGPTGTGAFSDPVTFAVNHLEGQAVASGDLTVTAAAGPATHLWYIDHAATDPTPGGTAVLIGTGFGTHPAVRFGDLDCTVTDVHDVAEQATGDGPQIVPGVRCDPWHQQISFTIPDLDADHDGDAVTVIGGD